MDDVTVDARLLADELEGRDGSEIERALGELCGNAGRAGGDDGKKLLHLTALLVTELRVRKVWPAGG